MVSSVVMFSYFGLAASYCTLSGSVNFQDGDVFAAGAHSADDCCSFCCSFGACDDVDSFTWNSKSNRCYCKHYAHTTALPSDVTISARCPAVTADENDSKPPHIETNVTLV